jgi:heptosyltransferase I
VGPYRRFHDLMIDAYGDPGEALRRDHGEPAGTHGRITVAQVLEKVERWRTHHAAAGG